MKRLVFPFIIILCCLILARRVEASDKVVIVIDPGHGGIGDDDTENGALYKDGLAEKDINLVTSLAMKDELMKYNNVAVYLTREDDTKLSLGERVDFASMVQADVMISCHYNASQDHLFYGSEIFTSAFGNCYMTGNALAQCIMKRWVDNGLDEKGIKVRIGKNGNDYYGVIRKGREAGLPVIIIEHGYLDNHIDYERLGTYEDWERMGRLDAAGIADYYGLSRDEILDEVLPAFFAPEPDGYVEPDTTEPEDVTLKITDLDIDTSEISYEIKATEPDGCLMYYGLALGEPVDIPPSDYGDLMLWDKGKDVMRGTFSVPTGYSGKVTARVYNIYELYTDSLSKDVDMRSLLEERTRLLEKEAREAAEEARKKEEAAAEKRRIASEKAKEREEVGDFSILLGGRNDGSGKMSEATRKRRVAALVTVFIILTVTLLCIIIYSMRKKIIKFLKDREGL
ncbi:MAG: N-acetylmuramoyl-L-alanine amidase [Lachnospiraceae bacterium]|nr:N-acetylmuramoyl-L-alanine amidase [Lachnospiraceae bacterium]